jgi:hypothetical protein
MIKSFSCSPLIFLVRSVNGYPDEHKKNISADSIDQVANQLITVVAEVASKPSSTHRTITLNSALDNPHTWYLSGFLRLLGHQITLPLILSSSRSEKSTS